MWKKFSQGIISFVSNLTSGTIFEIKSENGKILDIDADGKLTMTRVGDGSKKIEIFENNITLNGNAFQGNYIRGNSDTFIRLPVGNGTQYIHIKSNSPQTLQLQSNSGRRLDIFEDRVHSGYDILTFSNYINGLITLGSTTSAENFKGRGTKIVSSNGILSEQIPSLNSGKNIVLETGVGYFSGSDGNILLNATNNGLIGIGTETPTEKLDVDGNIKLSGTLKLGQLTGTEAEALTPENGDLIYVTAISTVFTSVGFWGYENGSWIKL